MGGAILFRGNVQRTGALEATEAPKPKGFRWRFQAGGNVFSTPVVARGRLFLAGGDPFVYALE